MSDPETAKWISPAIAERRRHAHTASLLRLRQPRRQLAAVKSDDGCKPVDEGWALCWRPSGLARTIAIFPVVGNPGFRPVQSAPDRRSAPQPEHRWREEARNVDPAPDGR